MFKFLIIFTLLVFGVIFLLGGVTFLTIFRGMTHISRRTGHNASRRSRQQRHDRDHDRYCVIDKRTDKEKNQKIFDKDEGEYVHFEE